MLKKSKSDKKGKVIRLHQNIFDALQKSRLKHIGINKKVISLVDFTDIVILEGIKALNL